MQELELSSTQARELTDRIKVGVEAIWELVKQAYQSRAWAVLGYESWDDYCTREFGTSRIRLPREERQEVVSSMREIGMSIRAIAAATGSGTRTIQRDLQAGAVNDHTSTPAPITGVDGKTYARKPRPTATAIPQSELDELNALPTEQPTMEQPQPRRTPITETAMTAVFELGKVIKKLESITDDDRFEKNKAQIRESHLSDLGRAQTSLNNIIQNISL